MFVLNAEDKSIYVTRGDAVAFTVKVDADGSPYQFLAGDVVRFAVYAKKDASAVVLQKDFPVTEVTEEVGIYLSEADTRIGEVISKPVDYWYEVVLNPFTEPQTVIGYDDDGAKIFKLFPEAMGLPDAPIEPEDIPVVDSELDMTSTRPVENQAIARSITQIAADLEEAVKRLNALEAIVYTHIQNS